MSLLQRFRRWLTARRLRRCRISEEVWAKLVQGTPVLGALSRSEQHRLRELASLFLHQKRVVGAGDFSVDEPMRAAVAAQACLLILNLSLDYFDGWSEVIVYPDAFYVPSTQPDEAGVVHSGERLLGGEAWGRGPVLLSWADIASHHRNHPTNVILHEFAHKLDLLNGTANGMPPLHRDMEPGRWSEEFLQAYNAMLHQVQGGHRGRIDPYAVESPAEFFAVVTEFFFERPALLQRELPAVYRQLAAFYRQDPLKRLASA